MTWLREIADRVVYGGTRSLRPYEQALLARAATSLEGPDGSLLSEQLGAVAWVQRFHRDRQVNVHFGNRATEVARLGDLGEARCRIKLTVRHGNRRVTAAVITHLGLLASLEFSKPPKDLAKSPFEVEAVEVNATLQRLADAADRLEHGRP